MNKSLSAFAASLLFAAGSAIAVGDPAGVAKPDMVDGEVRKVDIDNQKLTVKHGEIKNLQMPGMTLVVQVKDPAMLSQVKVGDRIQFAAEKSGGAIVITRMQPTR